MMEESAVDTAQNDDGAEDGPEGVDEGLAQRLEVELAAIALPAVLLTGGPVVEHQRQTHQQAGDDTGLEHIADGGAGGYAVDDEWDGRRDDDADGTGCRRQRRGVALVVALLLHLGDHEGADGGHGGGAGAGDGGIEHGGKGGDGAQTAGEEADDVISQIQQALGDTAVAHEVAGQHEEGDGHQGEAVDAGEGVLRHHNGVDIGGKHQTQHGGKAHGDADGKADRSEDDQADDQNS